MMQGGDNSSLVPLLSPPKRPRLSQSNGHNEDMVAAVASAIGSANSQLVWNQSPLVNNNNKRNEMASLYDPIPGGADGTDDLIKDMSAEEVNILQAALSGSPKKGPEKQRHCPDINNAYPFVCRQPQDNFNGHPPVLTEVVRDSIQAHHPLFYIMPQGYIPTYAPLFTVTGMQRIVQPMSETEQLLVESRGGVINRHCPIWKRKKSVHPDIDL